MELCLLGSKICYSGTATGISDRCLCEESGYPYRYKGYVLEWRIDTFCDTEHVVDLKVKKEVAKEHIDWMYKLTSDRYSPQEFFEGIKGAGEEEMDVGIIAI